MTNVIITNLYTPDGACRELELDTMISPKTGNDWFGDVISVDADFKKNENGVLFCTKETYSFWTYITEQLAAAFERWSDLLDYADPGDHEKMIKDQDDLNANLKVELYDYPKALNDLCLLWGHHRLYIGLDNCNGEEEQFATWMRATYPKIETIVENTLGTGLYDDDENRIEDSFWDEFCKSDISE